MTKIEEVLDWLSKKEWNLRKDWKQVKQYLDENVREMEEKSALKRYKFLFKEPLFFEHDQTTYKTGRIFAQYVLLPNKPIANTYLKKLIIPKKGYVFVSFDFSASQMRHLAVYKNLTKIKAIFDNDLDVYDEFGKETNIHDRGLCKKIMLTLSFGGTKETLKNNFVLELNDEDIENVTKVYEEWFKVDVQDYKNNVKLSHIAQRTEADFMKKKLIRLFEKQSEKYNLHAFIHDDIICEVNKNNLEHIEKIKKFLEKNEEIKMKVKVEISETFQFK
jgi:DNA polymerase I-like protein with 3'-5' exonuclease and polymerase domains